MTVGRRHRSQHQEQQQQRQQRHGGLGSSTLPFPVPFNQTAMPLTTHLLAWSAAATTGCTTAQCSRRQQSPTKTACDTCLLQTSWLFDPNLYVCVKPPSQQFFKHYRNPHSPVCVQHSAALKHLPLRGEPSCHNRGTWHGHCSTTRSSATTSIH